MTNKERNSQPEVSRDTVDNSTDGNISEEEKTISESTASKLLSSALIQEKCAKRSLLHQRIRTLLVVLVVIIAISMVTTINAAMHDVQILTNNASYAVSDLSKKIDELDLQQTLSAIDDLVQNGTDLIDQGNDMIRSSSEDIETSLKAIASLDVEGLNESIKALETVTSSIGKIFGYKGK